MLLSILISTHVYQLLKYFWRHALPEFNWEGKKTASWSPHYHLRGKPRLEPRGHCRHGLVPRQASGQRGRHHSWAWPIQVVLRNTIFIAESKAGFLITPGKKGKEGGSRSGAESENICVGLQAAGSTQEPPFFFSFSETGHLHCSEEDLFFSLLETRGFQQAQQGPFGTLTNQNGHISVLYVRW